MGYHGDLPFSVFYSNFPMLRYDIIKQARRNHKNEGIENKNRVVDRIRLVREAGTEHVKELQVYLL